MSEAALTAVVADLQRRLAEAEETVRAIREGEVDALVIRGAADDEIFTITGGDEGYRSFMEAMELGAAAVDDAGRVVYANQSFCTLVGGSLEAVQARPLDALLGAANGAAVARLLGSGSERRTAALTLGSGESEIHLVATVAPLRLGTVSGHAVTLTDVTERVRAEAAEKAEQTARSVIAAANEAMLVCDRSGVIVHANAAASLLSTEPLVGRTFAEAVPLVIQGTNGLLEADDVVAMALDGEAVRGFEAVAPRAPKVRDYLVSAAPLQRPDTSAGCVVTLTDLSRRKSAEKQQQLLMAELDHRVKNILTLVLSIGRKMARTATSLEAFQSAFIGRIEALAATHTLLADRAWADLSIREIVLAELAPYVDTAGRKVSLVGIDVAVSSRSAIALGLVFHELATNAAKYGALSVPNGRITVRSLGAPSPQRLTLEWRESEGPPVAKPTRIGFGQTVITRSMQYAPGGGAEIEYDPSGLVCRMTVPLMDG